MDEKKRLKKLRKALVVTPEEAMRHLRSSPPPSEEQIKELVETFDQRNLAEQKEKKIKLVGDEE